MEQTEDFAMREAKPFSWARQTFEPLPRTHSTSASLAQMTEGCWSAALLPSPTQNSRNNFQLAPANRSTFSFPPAAPALLPSNGHYYSPTSGKGQRLKAVNASCHMLGTALIATPLSRVTRHILMLLSVPVPWWSALPALPLTLPSKHRSVMSPSKALHHASVIPESLVYSSVKAHTLHCGLYPCLTLMLDC